MTLSTVFLVGPPPGGTGPGDTTSVVAQLEQLGLRVDAPGDRRGLAAAVSAAPPGRVALVDRRLVAHTHALRLAVLDPRVGAGVADGVISVDQVSRPALVAALDAPDRTAASPRSRFLDDDVERMRRDVTVVEVDPAPLVLGVGGSEAEAAALRAAIGSVDEERVWLRQAVKPRDGFFTTFFVSPYSRYVARWCARRHLTPNQVTLASVGVALLAAALCATGERGGYVVGALLLQVAFVLDCVDGQLARHSLAFSRRGTWLDSMADRAKEYAVFAGLAVGSARSGDPVWVLATAALVFQVVRHFLHFGYSESVAGHEPAAAVTRPIAPGNDREAGWSVWLRRTAVLPIGERWLLITLVAAVSVPRAVFAVLLVAGVLAFVYGATGRVLRSLRGRAPGAGTGAAALGAMLDLGPAARLAGRLVPLPVAAPASLLACTAVAPLAAALVVVDDVSTWWLVAAAVWYAALFGAAGSGSWDGRLDWTLPSLARAAEYALVLGVVAGLDTGAAPAAFALLAVVAYHHYDVVYRLRSTSRGDGFLTRLVEGHDGRVLTLALAAALWPGSLATVLWVSAVLLALVHLSTSVRWWMTPDPLAAEGSREPLTTMGDHW